MRPPTTHTNWKRVSNRANTRPRIASGPSRCSRLSNPSRPPAAPIATPIAVSPNPAPPPSSAPSTARTAGSTRAEATMISSRNDLRSTGAAITPMNPPIPLATPMAPSAKRSFLNENAEKKSRKPTLPRSTAIELPASRMLGWWSSAFSSSS